MNKNSRSYGFTIVELLVVIVVIGILASITAVSYSGVQSKAKDAALSSSVNNMSTAQQLYAISNSKPGKSYQSSSGYDSDLGFKPSGNGEVIEVATNTTDYCVRGYITGGTKSSLSNAMTTGSSAVACSQIPSSVTALSNLTAKYNTTDYSLNPLFQPTIINYSTTVPNAIASITLTPTVQTASSTIKINGIAVASGSAGPNVNLAVGSNTINVEVKSADGLLVHSYSVVVTRL